MKAVALFDIADQSFTFYTDLEWRGQVEDWRTDLAESGYAGFADVTVDEVVELTSNGEYFWGNIEGESTKTLFDIADQSFSFYSDQEWEDQITHWIGELWDNDVEIERTDVDEIVEYIGGDEYFWAKIA